MAVTQNTYTGDGTTVLFSFTFPYLETTDIKVNLNGVITTAYTLANATTVQFNTAPANGVSIRIYRVTDDASLAATFYPGSAIRSQDLNENFTQNLYVTQEVNNYSVKDTGNVIFTNDYTFLNPVTGPAPSAENHFATKSYVDAIATNAGNVTSGDKGDITISANLATWSLEEGAVTTSKLAANAVTSEKIANGTIVDADIGATAEIAATKISGTAVTQTDTGTVTSTMIADGTILNADISATAAIAGSKIQAASTSVAGAVQLNNTISSTSTTQAATANSVKTAWDRAADTIPQSLVDAKGDLLAATASDTVARLGVGTNNTFLTANSAESTGLQWTRGNYALIGTLDLNGVAAGQFTSGIDTTYETYQLVYHVYGAASQLQPQIEFSTDGGATWNTTSTIRRFTSGLTYTGSTTPSSFSLGGNTSQTFIQIGQPASFETGAVAGEIYLVNLARTTLPRCFYGTAVGTSTSGLTGTSAPHSANVLNVYGAMSTTNGTAINGIRIYITSGTFDSLSRVALYGIKTS